MDDGGGSWLEFGISILILLLVTGLLYNHAVNSNSLSWFWRFKEHPSPSSPEMGLWGIMEVPDMEVASWSWFGFGQGEPNFLYVLSVCWLPYFLTENRQIWGYLLFFMRFLSEFFWRHSWGVWTLVTNIIIKIQGEPNFLYVCQSVSWLTYLLKWGQYRNISCPWWDIFLKFFEDIPWMFLHTILSDC